MRKEDKSTIIEQIAATVKEYGHFYLVDTTAMNAAILAVQMLALSDTELAAKFADYKTGLKKKIVKANEELKEIKFEYKTN